MRKIFLLLFLIPVLSWADCPGGTDSLSINGKGIYTLEETRYFINAMHCDAHRCQKEIEELHKKFPERRGMDRVSASCVCSTLGGGADLHTNVMKDYISCTVRGTGGMKMQLPKSVFEGAHFVTESKSNPVTTQPKVTIDDAKKQCEDIGFKPKTEKFGECVLELNR